jgi:hypothetical protein
MLGVIGAEVLCCPVLFRAVSFFAAQKSMAFSNNNAWGIKGERFRCVGQK